MFKKIAATAATIKRNNGQTLTEYALIISLIALGALVAFGGFVGGAQGMYTRITDAMEAVMP